MTAGFPGSLGVVRVQVAQAGTFAALPQPVVKAQEQADDLVVRLGRLGGSDALIDFDRGDSLACWVRARDVIAVDVVSTEDPSA